MPIVVTSIPTLLPYQVARSEKDSAFCHVCSRFGHTVDLELSTQKNCIRNHEVNAPIQCTLLFLLEFTEWCEDFKWIHDRSAGHGSERNGIAETAVRQVNEGTSSLLVLSGLPGSSRVGAMECHYYLRKCSGFGGRYRTWRRMCPHRNPPTERSQIRKVRLQKWRHKNGSTAFMLTSART